MALQLTIAGAGGSPAPRERVDALLAGRAASFEGVYLHVPFCFHKCHYCDFYSFVDREDRQEPFVARAESEVRALAPFVRSPLRTLFVGGGTPTLLRAPLLARLLGSVRSAFPWDPGAEWTVEANPETVTDEVADALAAVGVGRVSLGAQSFDPRHLKTLERWHDPESVARAVERLRAAGIGRVSVDLIFGIPGQSIEDWERDLRAAVALGTDHLSCYGLTYEANTAMTARMERGEFAPCDEEVEARMLDRADALLREAGFARYEVSNWARVQGGDARAEECRHNLLYWEDRDWLAVGPSASGHASGVRWKNVPRLGDWLEGQGASIAVDIEHGTPDVRAGERLMMGLRLVRGLPEAEVEAALALGDGGPRRRAVIEGAVREGRMERSGGFVRFTARGMMLANVVLSELV